MLTEGKKKKEEEEGRVWEVKKAYNLADKDYGRGQTVWYGEGSRGPKERSRASSFSLSTVTVTISQTWWWWWPTLKKEGRPAARRREREE